MPLFGTSAVERIGIELVAQTGKFAKQVDGAVDKAQGKFGGLAKKVGGAMVKVGAVGGLAIAGLGAASVKMAVDFEKSMAEVKTLLPDLSEKGFKSLQGDVLDLSKEMGIATSEMVPALYQAISAGIPPENVIEFLRTGAKASIGGVTDLATAVDGLSTVVNAFGYDAADTGRVADVMFTAVKLGKTTMGELSASMFQAAPLAAALGLDIEHVAGATATLTKSGTPTAQAMTQLRGALTALSKPTTEMKDLLAATGYESGEALLAAEGLAGGFGLLNDAAEGNKEVLGKALGSQEAMMAVLGLTGENAKVAAADFEAMNVATGASDEAFKTMDETVSRKFSKAMNSLRVEMTKIGIKVLPTLARGLELFSEGIGVALDLVDIFVGVLTLDAEKAGEGFRNLPDDIKPIGKVVWDIANFVRDDLIPVLKTAARVIKTAFEVAMDVAGPFFGFLFKQRGTLKSVGLAVLTIVAAFKAYKIAVRLARLATMAMKTSIRGLMGATGIGLAIIALTLLIEHWDKIKPIVEAVVNFLKGINWASIWGAIVTAFEAVLDFFTGLPGLIEEKVTGAIDAVTGFLQEYWQEALVFILLGPIVGVAFLFKDEIIGAIETAAKAAFDFVKGILQQHWKTALAFLLLGPIGGIAYLFRDQLKAAISDAFTMAGGVFEEVTGKIGELVRKVTEKGWEVTAAFWEIGKSIPIAIMDGIEGWWAALKGTLNDVIWGFERVINFLIGGINNLGNLVNGIIGTIGSVVSWFGGPSLPTIPWINPVYLGRLQGGGPALAGALYQVNELGIEMFQPFVSGTVIPLGATPPATGASKRMTNYGRIVNVYGPGRQSRDVLHDLDRLVEVKR